MTEFLTAVEGLMGYLGVGGGDNNRGACDSLGEDGTDEEVPFIA
jgi:hypothetical protein